MHAECSMQRAACSVQRHMNTVTPNRIDGARRGVCNTSMRTRQLDCVAIPLIARTTSHCAQTNKGLPDAQRCKVRHGQPQTTPHRVTLEHVALDGEQVLDLAAQRAQAVLGVGRCEHVRARLRGQAARELRPDAASGAEDCIHCDTQAR